MPSNRKLCSIGCSDVKMLLSLHLLSYNFKQDSTRWYRISLLCNINTKKQVRVAFLDICINNKSPIVRSLSKWTK